MFRQPLSFTYGTYFINASKLFCLHFAFFQHFYFTAVLFTPFIICNPNSKDPPLIHPLFRQFSLEAQQIPDLFHCCS